MSSMILDKSQNAYLNKVDNRKIRKLLQKADHTFTNKFINDYNSPNIPKDRKYERFKIKLRLSNKLMEKNNNAKLKSEVGVENNELVLKITQ